MDISDLHHHNLTSINLGLNSLDPGWDIGNHGNRKYIQSHMTDVILTAQENTVLKYTYLYL